MRLLVIEDHALLRESLCQYLREAGYLVDSQATGDEGLWAAESGEYDVVVLDLMLPGIDGSTILRRLRAMDNPVHILVISARDGLEDRLDMLDAGADDYLVKPFPKAGGPIRITGLREGNEIKIAIANPTDEFPDEPDRLFEPLFRRESSRHDAESHLGIGLTLSQEAARSMGGDLRAGRSGDDLEFTLVLPATRG